MGRVRRGSGTSASWPGEGVPQGRDPLRGRRRAGHDHRHSPRRDPLTAAGQHRPVRPGRALRRGLGALGATWSAPSIVGASGLANYRIVRYADDFVVMVAGTATTPKRCARRSQRYSPRSACACRKRRRGSPHRRGLRLPGLPHPAAPKRGTARHTSTPTRRRRRLASVKDKVGRCAARSQRTSPWRPAAPAQPRCCGAGATTSATACPTRPSATSSFTWRRVVSWLRKSTPVQLEGAPPPLPPGWWPTDGESTCSTRARYAITRYRYRGDGIPTPWAKSSGRRNQRLTGLVESRMRGEAARPVRERGPGKRAGRRPAPRPGPTSRDRIRLLGPAAHPAGRPCPALG